MRIVTLTLALLSTAPALASHIDSIQGGDTVYTNSGYTAVVNGTFPDGSVSVRINNSNYKYSRADLAIEGCLVSSGICTSDTVWTNSGYTAKLNGVFPNGSLSLNISNSNYRYDSADVAVRGCFERICSGDEVTTNSGYTGRVNGVFPTGKISITINSSNYVYSRSDLAGTHGHGRPDGGSRPSKDGILRVGSTIWTNSGYTGTVNGVFPNGTVSVKISNSNYTYDRADLAAEGCNERICSGDTVVTSSGYTAEVNGIFPSGKVSVKISNSNYVYSSDDLAAP